MMNRCDVTMMLTVTAFLLAPLPALAGFQCPATEMPQGDRPTYGGQDVRAIDQSVGRKLKIAIRHMQAAGMKSGDIVDNLVVADCSRIDDDPSLSDTEKAIRIRGFAQKLTQFIDSSP